MKFLNEKWLNMNKEVACRKILKLSNKDQIRNFADISGLNKTIGM